MNVSELARILKVTPQELLTTLPEIGFDVGLKAIKIDSRTAQKILRDWKRLTKQLAAEKQIAENNAEVVEEVKINKKIAIPNFVSVKEFSDMLELPVSKVLPELMKNGIFTSINEKIDYDTASIIAADLGVEVTLNEDISDVQNETTGEKLKNMITSDTTSKKMTSRAPVIVVMGHVDHGKTSLLDAIRKTDVTSDEAGGITQHIGAYQVKRNKKPITFIDTPGHEAFTAMRSRGARVADIAILVVAADDGVKPQTIESFNIIKNAKIPYIVAINKIDKEGADINKTKQELSSKLNITPEDWGGKIICAPISAKKNEGVEELLDMVILTTDVEGDNIKADANGNAIGTIIESHIDKGEGPVATILIQNGTLRIGDQLCFNDIFYGKVKALKDYHGANVSDADPSTPVKIIGLKVAPRVGDIMEVGLFGQKIKFKKIKSDNNRKKTKQYISEAEDDKIVKLNVVLKTDALGSGEAIEESLEKINRKKAIIKVISRGLGNITEGDIAKAEAANALMLGFNVKLTPTIEELARTKKVETKLFNIIYDLIDYVDKNLKDLIEPEFKRVNVGRIKVLAIFRTELKAQIVGGKVIEGEVQEGTDIEVIRNKEIIEEGILVNLQTGKQDVKSVEIDNECGLRYEGNPVIEVGDILNFHKKVKIEEEN